MSKGEIRVEIKWDNRVYYYGTFPIDSPHDVASTLDRLPAEIQEVIVGWYISDPRHGLK